MSNEPKPPEAHELPDDAARATSLVLVHTGEGKGKSTAAFGVVMRAVARGWPVAIVQFLKSGAWRTGEEKVSVQLGAEWWSIGEGFTWDSTDLTRDEAVARAAWQHARAVIEGDAHRLVVLDEITYPMNWGWIDPGEVLDVIRARPARVNIVATGRDAPTALVDVADIVTEMRNIKHAYDRGIVAKKGIDY